MWGTALTVPRGVRKQILWFTTSGKNPVIPSEARESLAKKNESKGTEILRCAQNDRLRFIIDKDGLQCSPSLSIFKEEGYS